MSKVKTTNTGDKKGLFTFSSDDAYLFKEGTHYKLYDKLGSRLVRKDGTDGGSFRLWAPNAASVSVIGDFNGWDFAANPLEARHDSSGLWRVYPGAKAGDYLQVSYRPEKQLQGRGQMRPVRSPCRRVA